MANVEGVSFRSRDSKRFDGGEALAPKRSFHNLRQLFKLPARVLTPLSNSHVEHRGRDPMVNQNLEPKTHRLLGPISPTRTRGIPSNSNTSLPNLRVRSSRNASSTVLPPPGRNISLPEPLSSPRHSQPNYSRPPQSGLRCSQTMNLDSLQYTSTYSVVPEAQLRPVSTSRRVFTDITRRINSPQLNFSRRSLGPRNSALISVPYASVATTATCQQTSPPRPVFINGARPARRAERSLSILNQELTPNSSTHERAGSVSTRDIFPTSHSFATTVSSLLRASEPTTAVADPSTPPKAVFTTNPRCIYTSQPHAYWAGRFTSLHDQYHSQMLHTTINDEKLLQSFVRPPNNPKKVRQKDVVSENVIQAQTSEPPISAIESDEVRRCKRVFYTLQSLCVTVEAKRSLWGFQLRFARERKMEACLPDGATMEPEKTRPWTKLSSRGKSMTSGSIGETF
jgi:hypothetical protein